MADLDDIAGRLSEFATERDWEQFHTARNLVLALVGEVGELAEQMQWRTEDEVRELMRADPAAISDEVADVAIYVIRLADVLGINLGEAINTKIKSNEARYPADEIRGKATRASERTESDS
jgi:dCTP diphosphatase